jgi:aldehyde dehydrogenase (NAD+)
MNAPERLRPAFIDGKPKGLFIDGHARPALSGKTFDSISPSTGEVLAQVAQGGRKDIDAAVSAARRAFEGEWSRFKPFDRQQVILKLADLVDKHYDELALLDTLDMGGPISRTR